MFEFTMLAAAVKGTTVLAAASLIAWTLRKRSAAARHLVWTAAAAALLALPILTVTLPALRVPAPSAPMVVFQVFSGASTVATSARAGAATRVAPAAGVPAREIDLRRVAIAL